MQSGDLIGQVFGLNRFVLNRPQPCGMDPDGIWMKQRPSEIIGCRLSNELASLLPRKRKSWLNEIANWQGGRH
jgi:hypothetical protein